jgi:hypothetical protein
MPMPIQVARAHRTSCTLQPRLGPVCGSTQIPARGRIRVGSRASPARKRSHVPSTVGEEHRNHGQADPRSHPRRPCSGQKGRRRQHEDTRDERSDHANLGGHQDALHPFPHVRLGCTRSISIHGVRLRTASIATVSRAATQQTRILMTWNAR